MRRVVPILARTSRFVGKSYVWACALVASTYMIFDVAEDLVAREVVASGTVVGYCVRPALDGPDHTVIVGRYFADSCCLDAEVVVSDHRLYPMGTVIRYRIHTSPFRVSTVFGSVIEDE